MQLGSKTGRPVPAALKATQATASEGVVLTEAGFCAQYADDYPAEILFGRSTN
jgi:hypothetical protein